jgi:hypothetical protein
LTYIYTGKVDENELVTNSADILSKAEEYDLPNLVQETENACIRNLTALNIKDCLQVAHLHGLRGMKRACFDFVRANATCLMLDLDFMDLSQENSDIWAELSVAISPDDNCSYKRRRVK